MKILSKIAAPVDANAPQVKRKDAVLAQLSALGAGAAVSFDLVRQGLGLDADALPDGAIHQIAIDSGFKVEP